MDQETLKKLAPLFLVLAFVGLFFFIAILNGFAARKARERAWKYCNLGAWEIFADEVWYVAMNPLAHRADFADQGLLLTVMKSHPDFGVLLKSESNQKYELKYSPKPISGQLSTCTSGYLHFYLVVERNSSEVQG